MVSKEEGNTSIVGDTYIYSKNIESLPDELLFDILVRLPADDLYEGARLVCRRWSHIIGSDTFVNTHFHHSSYGLVISDIHGSSNTNPIYVSVTKQGRIEISKFSRKCRTLWSSCNGLVLVLRGIMEISPYILNPATKQAFEFDSKFVLSKSWGIAYSAVSMEYKLVRSRFTESVLREVFHVSVLTVNGVDNTWRPVQVEHLPDDARELFSFTPLITEGFIHWVWRTEKVLTMNVETEIITQTNVPLPEAYLRYEKYYLSTGRYLTLLVRHEDLMWEVWEMKPAESGEWQKQIYHIKFEVQQLAQFAGYDHHLVLPLGWVKYPEVCAFRVYSSMTLIFYNLHTNEIDSTTELPCRICHHNALPHRNTLVWLS